MQLPGYAGVGYGLSSTSSTLIFAASYWLHRPYCQNPTTDADIKALHRKAQQREKASAGSGAVTKYAVRNDSEYFAETLTATLVPMLASRLAVDPDSVAYMQKLLKSW